MSENEIKENKTNKNNNEENNKLNRSSSSSKKKIITILDFENNPIPENKINSPRSLKSIKELGYILNDLIYYDFYHFKQKHSEIIPLNPEIQEMRYNFYEKQRQKKIEDVKESYKNLCDNNNENDGEKNINISNPLINNFMNNDIKSSAIKYNLKSFERMRAKSELDLIHMVQHEIQRILIKQDSEEKIKIQNEKKELFKQELQKKRVIENKKKMQKEKEKKEKEEEDNKIRQLKDKEKHEKETRKLKEEQEKEKIRLIQNAKKQKEEEERRIKFNEKINKILEDNRIKLYKRQQELELKEQERQKIIEKKRIMKSVENFKKSLEKKELIEKKKLNLQKQIKQIQEQYKKKKKKNEIKKKEFEELRMKEILKEKEL